MPPVYPPSSGEGLTNYYERRFGERVRQVKKGGGTAGGWLAFLGLGIALAIARALIYSTPEPARFDPPVLPEIATNLPQLAIQPDVKDVFGQLPQLPQLPQLALPNLPAGAGAEHLLDADEDLPLPEALCYRLYHESRQPGPSPAKRIWGLLDDPVQDLVKNGATLGKRMLQKWPAGPADVLAKVVGQANCLDDDERGQLADGLNDVLQRAELWDEASFHGVALPRELDALKKPPVKPDELVRFNRLLLQAVYPRQVMPARDASLEDNEKDQLRKRALVDLEAARRELGLDR